MRDAVPVGQGGMVAVLGTEIELIKSIIKSNVKKVTFVKLRMIMLMDK